MSSVSVNWKGNSFGFNSCQKWAPFRATSLYSWMGILLCFLKPYGISSVFYILEYYVFFFVLFLCLFYKWIVAKQSGLLFVLMLKVIPIFAVICFHVFDKMTIRRLKKKWSCSRRRTKIGRTNIEKYYYISKLHS